MVTPIPTASSRWPSAEAATRTPPLPGRAVFVVHVRPTLVLEATCPLLSLATAMVPSADSATLKLLASELVIATQSAPELVELKREGLMLFTRPANSVEPSADEPTEFQRPNRT